MREIVIDTETTGLDTLDGHRVVEIGAVELVDHAPTGQTFHRYLCPERPMPPDALAVHGLTAEFLADKPLFAAIADEFLAFIGDAPLVAHNAGFDIAFLNAELRRIAKPVIATERVIDMLVLVLARRKHAGGHNVPVRTRPRLSRFSSCRSLRFLSSQIVDVSFEWSLNVLDFFMLAMLSPSRNCEEADCCSRPLIFGLA